MSRHRAVRNLRPEDYQDYDDYYEDEPASPGLAPMSPSLAQFLRPREVPSFALDDVFESLPASGGQPDFQEDDFPAPGQASNASISWGKMKVKKGKGKWKKGKGKAKALLGTDEAKEDSKPQATGPENELQSGDLPKKRAVFHRERTDSDRARSEKAIEELTNSKRLASSQSVDDLSSLRSQLDAIDAADSIHASGNRPPEISVAYSSPKTGGSPLRRSASSTTGWRNSPTRFTVPKQASPSPKSSNSKTPKSPSSGFSLSAKERAHREKVLDMQSRLDAEQEASGTHKSNLNLVVIGHVDAGKSTLMGHLLFLKGQVSKKQLDKFEKESRELNKASFHFAWVLDQHKEERTRGITTDVGRGFFETPSKRVTLLDAPGHRDFVPNMITGASQADAAVLAVSAAAEEFEAGFQDDGQTKEHAVLAKSLGVKQLIVAVNKLDSVGWSRQRYEEILDKLCSFLTTLGFRSEDIWPVPVSGLKGINILSARASSSSSPSLSSSSSSSSSPCSQMFPSKSVSPELQRWYKGPSLVDLVDKLALPPREVDKKMRFCISDVFRSTTGGDCVAGNLLTGKLVVNDKVLIKPFALMAKVKKIERDEALVEVGKAGDALVLSLQILSDADKLKVGQVLCDPDFPVPQVKRFRTKIITLDNKLPIIPGCRCVLFMATCQEQVTISKLISLKVGDTTKRKPRRIPKNCRHAEVEITADRSLCIETFEDIKY